MNENTREAKGRRRLSGEERLQLTAAFKQREEPAADFARRHGLATSTLHRWVRAEGPLRRSRRRRPVFQEIRLPVDGVSGWAEEVCLPDGTRVRWNGVTGLAGIERLVQQLRRAC